jgi:hypothetical protein
MVSCTPFLIIHAHMFKVERTCSSSTNNDIITSLFYLFTYCYYFFLLHPLTNLLMKHDVFEVGCTSVFRQVAYWLKVALCKGYTRLGAVLA